MKKLLSLLIAAVLVLTCFAGCGEEKPTLKVYNAGEYMDMNLKSKLSQIVSLTKVFSLNGVIPELEIITHTPSDTQRMIAFMTNNR